MKLTEQEYELLSKDEMQLEKAIKSNYCRICNKDVLTLYDKIYQRLFKKKSKMLDGCPRCVLSDIKKLAVVYFQDKMAYETQNKPIETIEDEKAIEKPKKTTKAATTKKKAQNKKK